jgi:hypothetical protein
LEIDVLHAKTSLTRSSINVMRVYDDDHRTVRTWDAMDSTASPTSDIQKRGSFSLVLHAKAIAGRPSTRLADKLRH